MIFVNVVNFTDFVSRRDFCVYFMNFVNFTNFVNFYEFCEFNKLKIDLSKIKASELSSDFMYS